jgi:hypothetical protein
MFVIWSAAFILNTRISIFSPGYTTKYGKVVAINGEPAGAVVGPRYVAKYVMLADAPCVAGNSAITA